ncbi:hypothetical protein GCM10027569_23270 [Flindersiella endophytica]
MLAVTALLLVSYFVLTVSAILARPYIFAGTLLVSAVFDIIVEQRFAPVVAILRRAQFGISHRAFVQVFLFLLLVAITDANRDMSRIELLLITLLALAVPVTRIGYLGVLTLVRRRLLLPIETRNLALPEAAQPFDLPPTYASATSQRLLVLSVPPLLFGALGVAWDTFWPFLVVVALYVVAVGISALGLVRLLLKLNSKPSRTAYVDMVAKAVGDLAPEVILYFSGAPNTLYQVEMWYSTLARTNRRTLILVRGRHAIKNLARTDLPIICVPSQVDVMNFPLPDARISLYVVNVGNNIHFLREPRLKHVFIGHGDSDKVASFNPFSKVYDEIWVAGQAGRDRYARARVGVRDDEIVEVGRPQLDMIERSPLRLRREEPWPTRQKPLTVLYAPTWEGWTDDGFQTSVTQMSIDIVKRLLKSPVPIRIIYKPHPMIGTRDPKAAAADRKVRAMIAKAAAKQGGSLDPAAVINLESFSQQLAAPDLSDADEERLLGEWNAVFWEANAGRHLVIDEKLPRLFDCFNNADVLITDVSSLISDWLASNKPYIVSNPKAMSDEEFREQFPSSRAAYLLHPGCAEMDDILSAVTGEDRMAPIRQQEKLYLLGPDEPLAQERWNAAVERLIEKADDEWEGEHGSGPSVATPVDAETAISEPQGSDEPADDLAAAGDEVDEAIADPGASASGADAELAEAEVDVVVPDVDGDTPGNTAGANGTVPASKLRG